MHSESILISVFFIFFGAAVTATIALYFRQAMIVAYIVVGCVLGPWGLAWVSDANLIEDVARIGIIFLLFLLGLNLSPQKLFELLRETTLITLSCTLIFGAVAGGIAWLFGFSLVDVLVISVAASFSSTIIGLKLLPTTVLHHRHTGEVIVSVLLLQDLIAIAALLVLQGLGSGSLPIADILKLFVMLPVLGVVAWVGHQYLILPLFIKFDRIQEYIFLLTLAWCLSIAQLAQSLGLSYEIGAFTAGVVMATNPLAMHLGEHLKPLRDFFLVMFFFALGAGFNLASAYDIFFPAITLAVVLLLVKPVVFRFLLVKQSESNKLAWETGVRLGQLSEFSLLIVFVAQQYNLITDNAYYTMQLATMISFMVSAYWIVARYPSPIAMDEKLRRD